MSKPPITEPVCVYRAASLQEAHLVLEVLTSAGVAARIASDAVESLAGEVPFQLLACPIWAPKSQQDMARRVLETHRQSKQDPPTLFCYHCGAALDKEVPECPACLSELDWSP